jgi:hypothetical protein
MRRTPPIRPRPCAVADREVTTGGGEDVFKGPPPARSFSTEREHANALDRRGLSSDATGTRSGRCSGAAAAHRGPPRGPPRRPVAGRTAPATGAARRVRTARSAFRLGLRARIGSRVGHATGRPRGRRERTSDAPSVSLAGSKRISRCEVPAVGANTQTGVFARANEHVYLSEPGCPSCPFASVHSSCVCSLSFWRRVHFYPHGCSTRTVACWYVSAAFGVVRDSSCARSGTRGPACARAACVASCFPPV